MRDTVSVPPGLMGGLRGRAAELSACAFAVAYCLYLGYGPTLRPTNIAWMLHDDWAAYLWGFSFFRNAQWSWPLGNIPELYFPWGTSVGFTDANPWAAVIVKLFSPLLPLDFQFYGFWFLLCFVLQAWMGVRIGAIFTQDPVRRALCGMLFAASPLLPSRNAHVALCAFFFISAGLYLNLAPVRSRTEARARMGQACLWIAWAAGTHGYLSVMLLTLCVAACVRLAAVERAVPAWEGALGIAACVGTALVVYWQFGYIGWRTMDLTARGFGQFSSDLASLINPMGWSRLMPALRHHPAQTEGFAYLGLGALGLLIVGVCAQLRDPLAIVRVSGRQWPLILATLAMWVYAWSAVVTLRGAPLLRLDALYAPLSFLTGIFRGSGRFVWPLHLLLLTAAICATARMKREWLSRAVLAAALVLQVVELNKSALDFRGHALNPLRHAAWAQSESSYEHLALVPIHLLWVCRYDHARVNRLSYEAYRRRWTFNSGNFSRKSPGFRAQCDAAVTPDPQTIYAVVGERLVRQFRRSNFTCGKLDGLTVCVSAARPTPLLSALTKGQS